MTSHGLDTSQSTSGIHSNQGQLSSIRFANSIIGNLGASLRDRPLEDEDDDEDDKTTETVELSDLPRNDEELYIGLQSLALVGIREKSIVKPSTIPSRVGESDLNGLEVHKSISREIRAFASTQVRLLSLYYSHLSCHADTS